jgi:two-component system, LytTR family, sensor kinase|uniref:2TM domain-containing protein n=1 Tax=Polaribacter sp. TaxID=1920175 RepID=UPI004047BA15
MQTDNQEQFRYLKAKEKVQKLKGFYANLITYCLVIPCLVYINLRFVPDFHWFYFPILGWGMGLLFHGMEVYNYNPFLGKDWEQRKIKSLMEEEENRSKWQ